MLTMMGITSPRTKKTFLQYIKLTFAKHAKLLKAQWDKRKAVEMLSVA